MSAKPAAVVARLPFSVARFPGNQRGPDNWFLKADAAKPHRGETTPNQYVLISPRELDTFLSCVLDAAGTGRGPVADRARRLLAALRTSGDLPPLPGEAVAPPEPDQLPGFETRPADGLPAVEEA